MLLDRFNPVHWEALVYIEMFLAGIAAGAYLVGALLEWYGRGNSPLARTAHAIVAPLLALATLLLIVDLQRPERFWHMAVMSKQGAPMIKLWSPMNAGLVSLVPFTVLAGVSFIDFLISRGLFSLGPWRADRTLHGSSLGKVWATAGAIAAVAVASYSGVLLSVTNIPGWGHSTLIGALYVATSIVSGAAALVLVQTVRGLADEDVAALARTNTWLIAWWLLLVVVFLATLGDGLRFILAGTALIALVAAVVVGGLIPLALRFAASARAASAQPLAAALVLVGGFLLRYAIVMGPQSVR